MTDQSPYFLEAVHTALSEKRPLFITGNGTKKDICGRACAAVPLSTQEHTGIISYTPSELVITVRAGTLLTDIQNVLDETGQMLSFEPPTFGGQATIGGTFACNSSGPARPWGGSMRDVSLGIRVINGKGEHLRFGGEVLKNVAGYDITRLQSGALGTLGVITEISLKLSPKPKHSETRMFEVDEGTALEIMTAHKQTCSLLTAAFWHKGRLYLRLSGSETATTALARSWGGESVKDAPSLWRDIREFKTPYFDANKPLWRFSVRSSAPPLMDNTEMIIDWAGNQRWLQQGGVHDTTSLQHIAKEAGGHVSLFWGGDRTDEVRQHTCPVTQKIQKCLKEAFDPEAIFNPGRLYSWL